MNTREKIKKIGKEMIKQSNRSTQFPLFVVQHETRRHVDQYSEYDERERHNRYEDKFEYCEKCSNLLDNYKELPEECEDCGEDCYNHYKIEKELSYESGVFFTAEACEEHIQQNRYHYGGNAKSFAISAWRNEEMQTVLEFLCKLTDEEIPNYYK